MPLQSFHDITGHEEAIKSLQSALAGDRVSHAYLFAGEKGSGKKLLAGIFAMALECEESPDDACLFCASCHKAQNLNHPDIIRVTHDKPGTITVDEIRQQVVETAELKPCEGRYKVYIIADADKMTPQAQNALLKTIEEPPAYAVFLLLAVSAESLLETIVSRCVKITMKPLTDEQVRDHLMAKHNIPKYEAEIAAAFAQGNIGKAEEAVLGDSFMHMTEHIVHLLRKIHDRTTIELVEFIRSITTDKNNIQEYLDLLTLWFRDVLMYKATREIDRLVFKKEISDIKEQAERSSYPGLQEILSAIDKAGERLRANVSFELTMELLLLTIREKING